MKQIGCRDMGVDCNFVAKGNDDEQIKKDLWAHAEKSHADVVKSLTPEMKNQMASKMDALLRK